MEQCLMLHLVLFCCSNSSSKVAILSPSSSPLLGSEHSSRWDQFAFHFFLVHSLASQRVAIDKFIFTTADQPWLASHAGDDGLGVVPVARVRPVLVASVLLGTFEVQQRLGTASNLVGPVASFDSLIVEQSMGFALATLGHPPRAFTVEDTALSTVVFGEETELPWTTGSADWFG